MTAEQLSPFYENLIEETRALLASPTHHHASHARHLAVSSREWLVRLSNASSILYWALKEGGKEINWCGFYLVYLDEDPEILRLGPFQGRTACLAIPFTKGVCGASARTSTTQIIPDVHAFPGHIACDSESESEAVVPMLYNGKVVGVLDIDCKTKNGFSEAEDRVGLEKWVEVVMDAVGDNGWWGQEKAV